MSQVGILSPLYKLKLRWLSSPNSSLEVPVTASMTPNLVSVFGELWTLLRGHRDERVCFRHAPLRPRKSECKQQVAGERSQHLSTHTSPTPFPDRDADAVWTRVAEPLVR